MPELCEITGETTSYAEGTTQERCVPCFRALLTRAGVGPGKTPGEHRLSLKGRAGEAERQRQRRQGKCRWRATVLGVSPQQVGCPNDSKVADMHAGVLTVHSHACQVSQQEFQGPVGKSRSRYSYGLLLWFLRKPPYVHFPPHQFPSWPILEGCLGITCISDSSYL